MKKRKKLIGSISALILAITLMGFGVYAATSMSGKITSSVSFVSKDVKCTFTVDVDGGKYLSGGEGTNENEYRHKSQSINNENVNSAFTLEEFVMGNYTFDPTIEEGKTITYTINIRNDGSNSIKIKYTENKLFQNISGIMQVTKTNLIDSESISPNGAYEGSITLKLMDASADISVNSLDISFEVSKSDAVTDTPANLFTYSAPSGGKVGITGYTGSNKNIKIPENDGKGNIINKIRFYNNNTIENVEIPTSITGLENFAFSGCSNLNSIIINGDFTLQKNSISECYKFTQFEYKGTSESFKFLNNSWADAVVNTESSLILNTKIKCSDKAIIWNGTQWVDYADNDITIIRFNLEKDYTFGQDGVISNMSIKLDNAGSTILNYQPIAEASYAEGYKNEYKKFNSDISSYDLTVSFDAEGYLITLEYDIYINGINKFNFTEDYSMSYQNLQMTSDIVDVNKGDIITIFVYLSMTD